MKKSHYRFLVKPEEIKENLFESLNPSLINQIKNVFRLNTGSQVSIFDGIGNEYLVEISSLNKNIITGKVLDKKKELKNDFKIGLFCSLLKGDNFEAVLEKCTELGIDFFQPVIFDRSIIRELKPLKTERYKRITKEATEQSGRLKPPDILEPIKFSDAINKTRKDFNIVSAIGSGKNILDLRMKGKNINIFIGPEGDFNENEIDIMKKEDFLFFNLGDNILRSETACILASGIVLQNMLK
jgi:16S rRNA (uracil1498-N3)-methyltransferase